MANRKIILKKVLEGHTDAIAGWSRRTSAIRKLDEAALCARNLVASVPPFGKFISTGDATEGNGNNSEVAK